jgi:hypothetical protein
MIEALGKRGMSTLGINVSADASSNFDQTIANTIGFEMLNLMEGAGALTQTSKYIKANATKTGVVEAPASAKKLAGNKRAGYKTYMLYSFKRPQLRGKDAVDGLAAIRKTATDILDYLSRLTDSNREAVNVITEADPKNIILRTKPTEKHQNAIDIAAASSLKPNFFLIKAFLGMSVEAQEKMYGIESGGDILDIQVEGTDSNRESLARLRHHLEYMVSNQEDHQAVYQRALVAKNLRLTQHSGTSPQAHKLIRGLLANFDTTYALGSLETVGDSTLTQEDMAKITIMRMMDVDKEGPKGTLSEFDKVFKTGSNTYRAAQIAHRVFQSPTETVENLGTEESNLLTAAIKKGGLAMESFTGLIAAGAYIEARNAGASSVELSMFREDDGIANGIAFTMFNFGINAKNGETLNDLFGRVGIQVKGTEGIMERRDKAYAAGNKIEDMYQYFSKPILGIVNRTGTQRPEGDVEVGQVEPSYVSEADPEKVPEILLQVKRAKQLLLGEDVNGENKIAKVMRDVVKEPLMRYIYGAGNDAILGSVHEIVVGSLVQQIQKLQSDYSALGLDTTPRDSDILNGKLQDINEQLLAIASLDKNADGDLILKTAVASKPIKYVQASLNSAGRIEIRQVTPDSVTERKVPSKTKAGKRYTTTKKVLRKGSSKALTSVTELTEALGDGINLILGDTTLSVIEEQFGASRAVAGRFNKGVLVLGQMYAATYNKLVVEKMRLSKRNFITKGEMQEINADMEKAFPGIPSILTEKNGETRQSLLTIHNSDMKRGSNSHTIKSVSGKGNVATSDMYYKDELAAEHVVGSPYAIHSMDAAAIVDALLADNTIVQVYDGIIQDPLKTDATKASNGSFLDNITGDFSPLSAVAEAIEFAAEQMNELYGYTAKADIKSIGELLNPSKPSTLKSAAYTDEQGNRVQREYTHEDFIGQLKAVAKNLNNYKKQNKKNILQVNQYADVTAVTEPAGDKDLVASEAALSAMNAAVLASNEKDLGNPVVITSSAIPPIGEKVTSKDRLAQYKRRATSEEGTGVDTSSFQEYLSGRARTATDSGYTGLIDIINDILSKARNGDIAAQEEKLDSLILNISRNDFKSLDTDERVYVDNTLEDALFEIEVIKGEVEQTVPVSDVVEKDPVTMEDAASDPENKEAGTTYNNPKTEEEITSNKLAEDSTQVDDNDPTEVKHSSGSFTDNAVHEANMEVDNKSVLQLFRDLLTSNRTTESSLSTDHTTHLESIMTAAGSAYAALNHAVSVTINRRKDEGGNEGQVTFNDAASNIQINLRNRKGIGSTSMSAQEVMAHEFVHPFWRKGLDDRFVRQNAARLFDQVNRKKDLDFSIFLRNGVHHTPSEIATAKGHFNHVFRNGKEGLEEFLTFATTNEAFREKLSGILGETRSKPDGWFAQISRLFSRAVGLIFSDLRETQLNGNVSQQVDELFTRTTSVLNSVKQNKVNALSEKMGELSDKAFDKINSVATAGVLALTPVAALNSDLAVAFEERNVAENAAAIRGDRVLPVTRWDTVMNVLRDSINSKSEHINEHVRDIGVHVAGDKVDSAELGRLISKGTASVDAVSDNIKTAVLEQLQNSFTKEPSEDDNRDITNVIGRTDLSSLYQYNVSNENLVNQLDNANQVKQDIQSRFAAIEAVVGTTTARRIMGHIDATANFMVNENQNKGPTFLGAENIINYVGNIDPNVKTNKVSLLQNVDILLTLSALDQTDINARKRVAGMMKNPDMSDGIVNTLSMQRAASMLAKETQFNAPHTKHLHRKGYYLQNTDVNIDVQMAPLAEESIQRSKGYTLREEIIIPAGMMASKPLRMGVYTRNFGGNKVKSNSAMLSTSNKSFGEDLTNILEAANVGLPSGTIQVQRKAFDDAQRAQLRRTSDAYARGATVASMRGQANIVPTFTPNGNVGRFRMNPIDSNFKEKYLGLDQDFTNSLAGATAQLSYKVQAPIHNQDVINSLVDTYNRDFDSKPNDFIKLLPDDVRYKRIISSWDEATKKKVFSSFGTGGKAIYIKSNQITGIMGYHTFTTEDVERNDAPEVKAHKEILRHLNNLLASVVNTRIGAFTHHYTKEYVSELAKAIVVKTGTVAYANTVSNVLITATYGMDLLNTTRDSISAVKYARDYIDNKREENRLDVLVGQERAKQNSNPNKVRQYLSRQASVKRSMELSPIHELAKAGELSTVITDPSIKASNTNSARGKARSTFNKTFLSKGVIGKVVKETFLLEDSATYDFMQQATILTDFVFKFAMFEHNRKNRNMGTTENIAKIKHIFFDYNVSSPKPIEAMESAGLMMFTKFPMRAQRVAVDALDENASRAVTQFVLQTQFAGGTNMFDANYIIGDASPTSLFHNPFTKVDDLVQINPLLRMAGSALTEK